MSQEDEHNRQLQEEASNLATSAQRLKTLCADASLWIIIASNPAAPAECLERLAQDQDAQVREKVASNPNTPWRTLERLAWEFPHAFLHNPIGPLQLVAHPEQVSTNGAFWDVLLREASIPAPWWNWLLSHPHLRTSQTTRLHVQYAGETTHPYGVPGEAEERDLLTLVKLLSAVLAYRASRPTFSANALASPTVITCEQIVEEHLHWMAQSVDAEVRSEVAGNPQTQAEVLDALALDGNAEVRSEVAGNPQTQAEVLGALALDGNAEVRSEVARNQQTPTEVLHTLAQDPEKEVRKAVAWNVQTPGDVLRFLAQDEDVTVRYGVLRNPRTSVEILQILTHSQARNERKEVTAKEQTPGDVWRTLALDHDTEVRCRVAANAHTPMEVLQILAQDRVWYVRAEIARNKQTPMEVLQILALDEDADVRRAVALNRQTPVEILRTLALDHDAEVRWGVSSHPETPEDVWRNLAQDEAADVRWMAHLVQKLINDVGESFRQEKWWEVLRNLFWWTTDDYSLLQGTFVETRLRAVAELEVSESVREIILSVLATGWDTFMINSAFSGKNGPKNYKYIMVSFMPPIALQKLAASPHWEVRYLVALHERTTEETRQRLSQDSNRYVQAMANKVNKRDDYKVVDGRYL